MTPRLLLWDVDHTLIELAKLHYRLYEQALKDVFGINADRLPDMSGRTDRDSSTEFLTAHGIPASEDNLQRFWDGLERAFARLDAPLTQQGRACVGALEAVQALATVPGVYQSALTGNIRELAIGKLTPFGFGGYLDFDIGAYGEDDTERSRLVDQARKRLSAKHGVNVDLASTALLGDTPLDIAAARQSGAKVVAVATGLSTSQELRAAGADEVLEDLSEVTSVVATVLEITGGVSPSARA